MSFTFNPDKYIEILAKYQPKIIRTEEENEKSLAIVEELMHDCNRSPEENELYELLIALIEKFEEESYSPGAASTSHSMLLFLMEQQIDPADLVAVIGSQEVVSELVNGKRDISYEQAKALGDFFHVDSSLFI